MQHYVIKFVSNLRQVGGFLLVLRFPPPIELTCNDITEILLKMALNTINQKKKPSTCSNLIQNRQDFVMYLE
jgi:hypothetical protein